MVSIFITFFLALCGNVYAASVHASKTLVLYDERLDQLDSFSNFLDDLKSREYEIDYYTANSTADIELYEGENRLYDNLIVLPVKGKHINKLISDKTLLQFYNDGGDILSVTSPGAVPDSIRLFLNQLGIFPSPKGYELVDNVQGSLKIGSSEYRGSRIYEAKDGDSISLSSSSAALLDNREQIFPILAAPRTSYTGATSKDPWSVGSQGFLAAAFQNLKNARVAWLGSVDFLKNEFYGSNGNFVQEVAKWVFQEKNVIKSVSASHFHADGTSYEEVPYKIKDTVIYEVGFSEWNGEKWVPFITDDIQFELKMLDPYYRLTLKPGRQEGEVQYYTTGEFNLPDHHGVFTFETDYKRDGFSFAVQRDVKPIRNLAHSEYARSWDISNAVIYLSSIFSVIFAWIIFIIFFITASPAVSKSVNTSKKNN
ncbi:hypothetical protein ZYGR_0N03950 [Zygosaccharomyces rouxii]|uniref:Dolichyl-diphosphooligosaccharide--protein glycosyltransferase subunit WBP1 n=2 Tax=Zygosaccharomyces rouxii TaxID=4956 RepID=C5DVT9_ZYGRC|nr:uncharacterized protein ZYRO0D09350g [Zygosaccharomyces rouxii]KAH9200819.1 Dolichyl-diphosphooligosaccharide--protein glycosyltransferase subunit WBP1 [Zygosaccharomyces rouxii]GAV48990.1 hypothetical protein ZYGR_0N03950 [Zygosaccharomyces rouxii]CAR27908.1 ZYRO0D09350p [Zygosaccharomyces rouxii]